MDALSVMENPSRFNQEYISQTAQRMHACGHDGHMAMLLAAAAVLQSRRKSLKGTIKLIFQPNEENVAGARAQIQDGILEEGKCGPSVDQIYGIHLKANQTTGTVVVKDGPLMAASDRFSISVKGSGGHGGMPAEGILFSFGWQYGSIPFQALTQFWLPRISSPRF
jgi:amidohydrolase